MRLGDHCLHKRAVICLGRDLGKLLTDKTRAMANTTPDAQRLLQQVSIRFLFPANFIIFSVALQREDKC